MNRRDFVKYASSVAVLLANGNILRAGQLNFAGWERDKVKLRFVVASDGHYGEPDTAYEKYFATVVERIGIDPAGVRHCYRTRDSDLLLDGLLTSHR